jgi:hypothetical protein
MVESLEAGEVAIEIDAEKVFALVLIDAAGICAGMTIVSKSRARGFVPELSSV